MKLFLVITLLLVGFITALNCPGSCPSRSSPYQEKIVSFFNAQNEARTCPESFIPELITMRDAESDSSKKASYDDLITYLTGKAPIAA